MIHVIATIVIAAGRKSDYLDALDRVLATIRAEAGCIDYAPVTEVDLGHPAQQSNGPDALTLIERWESEPALRAHLVAPHMLQFRAEVAALVRSQRLAIYRA